MSREFAPNFETRFHAQHAFEKAMLSKKEFSWKYNKGIYQDHFFAKDVPNPVEYFTDLRGEEREISGLEVLLANQINAQLTIRSDGTPVNVLDIGGGLGTSWSRLALRFEDEVLAGNVNFIVSNLKNDPEDFLPETIQDDTLLSRTRHLVHYINGTFAEIGDKSINKPDGTTIPLRGNIAIVHENLSVTAWSKIPEWDILEVAGLVEPSGIYVVNSSDLLDPMATSTEEENNERLQGILLAHKQIQRTLGFTKVQEIEEGLFEGREFYDVVFKGPDAPAIQLTYNYRDSFVKPQQTEAGEEPEVGKSVHKSITDHEKESTTDTKNRNGNHKSK